MAQGVEIRVRSDSRQAKQDIKSLGNSIKGIETTINNTTSAIRKLAIGLTAALTGGAVVKAFSSASDSIVGLENRLALVVGRGQELTKTMKSIRETAAQTRLPVRVAADTFNRLGISLKGSNKTSEELIKATKTILQTATISGATASSAEAAIIQLGQGLASGTLRGEELNSVLEQIPRLAEAIADGMKVPFGELRALAKEGLIDAQGVFKAITDPEIVRKIQEEFELIEATVESLTTVMSDEFTRALAAIDKEIGFSDVLKRKIVGLTKVFSFVADNIGDFVIKTKLQFDLFVLNTYSFVYDVIDVFTDLFSSLKELDAEDFLAGLSKLKDLSVGTLDSILLSFSLPTSEELVDQVKGVVRSAIDTISNAADLAFTFATTPITLDEIFPSIDTATTRISNFVDEVTGFFSNLRESASLKIDLGNIFEGVGGTLTTVEDFVGDVIDFFKDLMKKIVGNPFWWGIWKKEEAAKHGVTAVGDSGALLDAISPVIDTLEGWGESIKQVFSNLLAEVTTIYGNLREAISEKLFVSQLELGEGYFVPVESGFSKLITNLQNKWSDFKDYINDNFLEKTVDYGPFGTEIKAPTKLGNFFNSIGETFDRGIEFTKALSDMTLPEAFSTVLDSTVMSFEESTLGRFIKGNALTRGILLSFEATSNILSEALKAGTEIGVGFAKEAQIAATQIGLAIGAAWLLYSRTPLSIKLVATAVAIGPGALSNEETLEAIRRFGVMIGALFSNAVEGEKVVANWMVAIGSAIDSLSEGIISGLFGEEFSQTLSAGLAKSISNITIGIGTFALFSSKFRSLLLKSLISKTEKGAFTGLIPVIARGLSNNLIAGAKLGFRTFASFGFRGLIFGALSTVGLVGLIVDALGINGLFRVIKDKLVEGVSTAIGALVSYFAGEGAGQTAKLVSSKVLTFMVETIQSVLDLLEAVGKALSGDFSGAWELAKKAAEPVINLFTSGFELIEKAIDSVVETISNLISKMAELKDSFKGKIANIFGFGDSDEPNPPAGSEIRRETRASGGYISGPGTGTSDDIPAMLSNGEYVIKASSVSKFGRGFLDAINRGMLPQFFNSGGLVGYDNVDNRYYDSVHRLFQEYNKEITKRDFNPNHPSVLKFLEVLQNAQRKYQRAEISAGVSKEDIPEVTGVGDGGGDDDTEETPAEEFVKSFASSFSSAVSDLFKTGDFKSFFLSIADTFTSMVIDTVVGSFTESLFKEGSFLDGVLQGMYSGLEDLGAKAGEFANSLFKEDGALGGLFKKDGLLSNLFSGIGSFFGGGKEGGSFLGGLFGFNSGGIVPALGTTRTDIDSVPTMLTPGEMVLTKEQQKSLFNGDGKVGGQQTVVNLQITGDISRQTKQEVMRMIPQIAAGVNSTNRENNYRAR